jgi:hypothetical protein
VSGTTDPWSTPDLPALQHRVARSATVERTGGPERIVTNKPVTEGERLPLPVGFTQVAKVLIEQDPDTWEGDNA